MVEGLHLHFAFDLGVGGRVFVGEDAGDADSDVFIDVLDPVAAGGIGCERLAAVGGDDGDGLVVAGIERQFEPEAVAFLYRMIACLRGQDRPFD